MATEPDDSTNRHALVIGGQFDYVEITTKDAQDMRAVLTDDKQCAYPAHQVACILPEDATLRAVRDGLMALAAKTNQNSTVVIFYSGDGRLSSESALYLLPQQLPTEDRRSVDPEVLEQWGISGTELAALVRNISAQKLLVILDCCHAGAASLRAKSLHDIASAVGTVGPGGNSLDTGWGRVVLASSMPDERSYTGENNSLFTAAIIEALGGKGTEANSQYVHLTDLIRHTRIQVTKHSSIQDPTFISSGATDFPIALNSGWQELPVATQPAGQTPLPAVGAA